MRTFNLYYRICIYLTIALAICHPTIQIAATDTLSAETNIQSKMIKGKFKNGLTFSLEPSSQLKNGTWIKLEYSIPQENEVISLLTQHALFYGTKQYSREQITDFFNHLSLDVEADPYVQSSEGKQSLHFCLDQTQTKKMAEVLTIIDQMAFYPTLKNEEIELARCHLLASLEQQSEKDRLLLQSITAEELRQFHAQWYVPEKMHLTLVGVNNSTEILNILSNSFKSPVDFSEEISLEKILQDDQKNALFSLQDRVEWATDTQTFIVDGKIWMKEPNWINKSSNGKTLGALLTVVGIGGMILAFPILAPVALITGGLTTITGLYFLASDYIKDPYYVESIRRIDLQRGCTYAYQKHRAGITLTPYERRAMLLQEMIDCPQLLSQLPILILADVYQLNDPVIAELFTADEFNQLSRLKRDFIQQRNQFKLLQESLERELAFSTAPYALTRDAALLYAQDVYHLNDYVISKDNLKKARDASIAEVEEAYLHHTISLEEKDAMIEQAHAYYTACLSDPTFKAGLDLAESMLIQTELAIQATYSYQVEICKQSIQYYARMEQFKMGTQSLIHFFNQELISLLKTFPVYFALLPDYLDLRSL